MPCHAALVAIPEWLTSRGRLYSREGVGVAASNDHVTIDSPLHCNIGKGPHFPRRSSALPITAFEEKR